MISRGEQLKLELRKVKRLQRESVECIHALGTSLKKIYDNKLYNEMKDSKGRPKYSSWAKFCTGEIGYSARYSYRIMDVAANFTKDQVRRIGVSKLETALRLPEKERGCVETMSRSQLLAVAKGSSRVTGRDGFRGTSWAGKSGKPRNDYKSKVALLSEEVAQLNRELAAARNRIKELESILEAGARAARAA